MLSPEEAVIGPAFIEIGGVELGLTTDDGVELSPAFEMQFLGGAQSIVTSRGHRSRVDLTMGLTFHQLTLEKWRLAWDMKDAPSSGELEMKWDPTPQERVVVLTMPGSAGSTRVLPITAVLENAGALPFANNQYTGAPITLRLIGDPTTNSYGTITETASSATVPAVSTYQKIVATVETAITDGATNVEVAAAIQVTMNVAIRPDQLTPANFRMKLNDGNTDLPGSLSFGTTSGKTDYTKIVFTPSASLSNSTQYEILVAQGIKSFDGVVSTAGAAIQFTTAA